MMTTLRQLLAALRGLLPRYHTPEDVARELIQGLENGTIVLRNDELESPGDEPCPASPTT